MTDSAALNPAESETYQSMIRASHHPVTLFMADGGVVAMGWGRTMPTRAQLIEGWMTIPVCTPTHRDALGCWVYDERRLTLEEATAKVDALLGQLPVKE